MDPILLDVPTQYESTRLIMRCYQPGDGAAYFRILQANRDHLRLAIPDSLFNLDDELAAETSVRRFIGDWLLRTRFVIGVWERTSGAFIAEMYLGSPDWDIPSIELGYFVVKDRTGLGLGTEAALATVSFAFTYLGMARLDLRCSDENVASWRLAERCGFKQEGLLRRKWRQRDGRLVDVRLYGLLREDYSSLAVSTEASK